MNHRITKDLYHSEWLDGDYLKSYSDIIFRDFDGDSNNPKYSRVEDKKRSEWEKTMSKTYEQSIAQINRYSETHYIASLTRFEDTSVNNDLEERLQDLGFGFCVIEGSYKENSKVTYGKTYFIVCHSDMNFRDFTNRVIDLAGDFHQNTVMVWNTRNGFILDSYISPDRVKYFPMYDVEYKFNDFNVNSIIELMYSNYRKYNTVFHEPNGCFTLKSCTKLSKEFSSKPVGHVRNIKPKRYSNYTNFNKKFSPEGA